MAYMAEHAGPPRGYHSQCNKPWYVCARGRMKLWPAFEAKGLEIQFTWGHRYLGGWLGDVVAGEKAWIKDQVVIVGQYPQSAYAGFVFCIQSEWQYVSRVMQDIAQHCPLLWAYGEGNQAEIPARPLDAPTYIIGREFCEASWPQR
ncbi:hypothetical protein ACHAWF_005401 [Thalassiosira exigua]